MKKILLMLVICLLPLPLFALKGKNFEHNYVGDWVITYYCGVDDPSGDGTITIDIDKVKKNGKITKATVTFSNNQVPYTGKGKIFWKNGKRKINLDYSTADYLMKIKGTISKTKIKGKYIHDFADLSCAWGGTVNATAQDAVGIN